MVYTFAADPAPAKAPRLSTAAETMLEFIPAAAFFYAMVAGPLSKFGGPVGANFNTAAAEGDIVNKIVWISLLLLAGGAALRVRWRGLHRQPAMFFLICYFALALASIAWSGFPYITLRRGMLQLCVIAAMLSPFALGLDPDRVLRRVAWAFYVAVVLSLLAAPLSISEPLGIRGIYGQKNILGQVTAVTAGLAFWDAATRRDQRWLPLAMLALAIFELVVSKSKTSLALLIVGVVPLGVAYILSHGRPAERLAAMIAVLTAVALVWCWIVVAEIRVEDVSMVLFGDPTFTGRDRIWEFANLNIADRPLLGHGYGAFWGVGDESAALSYSVAFIGDLLQAHNGYVDVKLELGAVGLTLVWLMIAASILAAIRTAATSTARGLLVAYLLFFCYMNNVMESSIFRSDSTIWLTLLLCYGCCARGRAMAIQAEQEQATARSRDARA